MAWDKLSAARKRALVRSLVRHRLGLDRILGQLRQHKLPPADPLNQAIGAADDALGDALHLLREFKT